MTNSLDTNLIKKSSYINGEWLAGSSEIVSVSNPATGDIIIDVASCSEADARDAVAALLGVLNQLRKEALY